MEEEPGNDLDTWGTILRIKIPIVNENETRLRPFSQVGAELNCLNVTPFVSIYTIVFPFALKRHWPEQNYTSRLLLNLNVL
jgi:hypothetical protein